MTTKKSTISTAALWDEESASKAAKEHKYIFVSENQKQRKCKLITGAEKYWKEGKQYRPYIYISSKRIMGLKDAVVSELARSGHSESEIQKLIKSAYTKDNHGEDYRLELQRCKEYKKVKEESNKDKIKYHLSDLDWFMESLKDAYEEPIDKNTQKMAKVSPKSKRDLFRELYQKAQQAKQWVDVSALETTGAKVKSAPSKTKAHCVSMSIESDNLKMFKKAIEWLHGSIDAYEADIEKMKADLGELKSSKTKSIASKTPVEVESKIAEPEVTTTKVTKDVAPKKKQMGSPRKIQKSPGAVKTTGGESFTPMPPLKKVI